MHPHPASRPRRIGLFLTALLISGCQDNPRELARDHDARQQGRTPANAASESSNRPHARLAHEPAPGSDVDASAHAAPALRGRVLETFDAANYTYLRLETPSGPVWAAIGQTPVTVGQTLELVDVAWMKDFNSASLNRTFDRIAFAGNAIPVPDSSAASPAAPPGHAPAKSADPATDRHAGMPPPRAGSPHAAPSAGPAVPSGEVAPLDGGYTVAQLFAQKSSLAGQTVRLRARVVKANSGILGRNWLHLQDGTGEHGSDDITATSVQTAAVGDTVIVEGVLNLDKNLGSGYFFPLIIEDAKLLPG